MAFHDRLKEARTKKKLTQEKLAHEIGVAKSTYTGYEKGNSEPNMLVLSKLMDALDVDANFLFQDESRIRYDTHATPAEMEHLVKKYRLLSLNWKEAVDDVLDIGYREYEERQAAQKEQLEQAAALREQRRQMEAGELPEPENVIRFRVPEYTAPMSAGPGEEAMQEFPEDIELVREPPRGTSYMTHIKGSSMEPTFHDGDMVFVHACQEILVGRIGVFFMDGKQWVKELGDGTLISHNPAYDPIPMRDDIRCQGLVLGVCDESYLE